MKLGVPGRPAGGVDALATIPGYAVQLTEAEVGRVVERCGYAHFLAGERFAPMDARLFAHRRATGAVAVPPLAAASLLSKKIAVGLRAVGLDVRVGPHGNFGTTMDEARFNAQLFCRAARLVGIEAVAFLFDSGRAEQPWIGRGEALVAVDDVLQGSALSDLEAHAERCFRMAAVVAEAAGLAAGLVPSPDPTKSRTEALAANLEAQGGSITAFRARAGEVRASPRRSIYATVDGTVRIDMAALRDAIVDEQRASEQGRLGPDGFRDPAGVLLRRRPGDRVRKGDTLADVRLDDPALADLLMTKLAAAVSAGPDATPATAAAAAAMEIVRA